MSGLPYYPPLTVDDGTISLRAYLTGQALQGLIQANHPFATLGARAVRLADDAIRALHTPKEVPDGAQIPAR